MLTKPALKAFTLIELLVAMLLSSIVIGSTIMVWLNVDTMFRKSLTQTYGDTGAVLFLGAMNHDLARSENIRYSLDELTFSYADDADIVYEFDEGFVTRSVMNNTDTFRVALADFQAFDHEKLPGVIKSISFTINNNKQQLPVFFTKEYSPGRLFNYQTKKP